MSRIFITGSADGLGLMAARLLLKQHHEVVLHARNTRRADDVRQEFAGSSSCYRGRDDHRGSREVANQANECGRFDAIIHNVAVGYQEPKRLQIEDGLPHIFAVNVLAPYILTALITRPDRLIYLSSGLHQSARAHPEDLLWTKRPWDGTEAYSESKLYDVMLAFAIARRWKDVYSNALEPGWVATKMGGPSATDEVATTSG